MKTASIWYNELKINVTFPQSVMEILAWFFVVAIEKEEVSGKDPWFIKLYDLCVDISKGHYKDMSNIDLSYYLDNVTEREAEMVDLLEKVKLQIDKEEKIITPDRLNEFETAKDWGDEFKTNWEGRYLKRSNLIDAIDNLKDIVNQNWNKIWYKAPFEGFLPGGWPEE